MKRIVKHTIVLLTLVTSGEHHFAQCFKSVSAGGEHAIAIASDGGLWAWGFNYYGQVGNGTSSPTNHITSPVQIGSAHDWKTVIAGEEHSMALKNDGTLWAWGSNHYGAVGNGSFLDQTFPVSITAATDWKMVSGGGDFSMALKNNGTLWAWGWNQFGEIGDGTNVDRGAPIQIGTASDWKMISAGDLYSTAIKNNGTLWAWGQNVWGQLGNGTTTSTNAPAQIGTATDWQIVIGGDGYTMAYKNDGSLWAWGDNTSGQFGNSTNTSSLIPVQISAPNIWQSIGIDYYHTAGIKPDGTLWSWGKNTYGQLGDGTNTDHNTPVQVGTATDWGSLSVSDYHTMAQKTDGSVWGWGYNAFGQLGNGTIINTNIPVQISPACPCTGKAAEVNVQTPCSTYTSNGHTYTASGVYTELHPNTASGCNDIVTINLVLNYCNNSIDISTPTTWALTSTIPAGTLPPVLISNVPGNLPAGYVTSSNAYWMGTNDPLSPPLSFTKHYVFERSFYVCTAGNYSVNFCAAVDSTLNLYLDNSTNNLMISEIGNSYTTFLQYANTTQSLSAGLHTIYADITSSYRYWYSGFLVDGKITGACISDQPCNNCTPVITASACAGSGSGNFFADATGTTYQWQVDDGTGFTNLADNTNYSGSGGSILSYQNLPSSWYGYQYRCIVDGNYGNPITLTFSAIWTGAVDNYWDNPGNWSCGAVPDVYTDVFVNSGTVIVNSNGTCRSITINPAATFTVNTGITFIVTH